MQLLAPITILLWLMVLGCKKRPNITLSEVYEFACRTDEEPDVQQEQQPLERRPIRVANTGMKRMK